MKLITLTLLVGLLSACGQPDLHTPEALMHEDAIKRVAQAYHAGKISEQEMIKLMAEIDKARKSSIRALGIVRKMEREQYEMATELGLTPEEIERYKVKVSSLKDVEDQPEGFWGHTWYYTSGTVKGVVLLAISPIYITAELCRGNDPLEKLSSDD